LLLLLCNAPPAAQRTGGSRGVGAKRKQGEDKSSEFTGQMVTFMWEPLAAAVTKEEPKR
jgi:hypothetical protein